ncbi:hypothetical protein ACJ73_02690 [Blastomyces percursus]|uniref:Myb-like domain-containing protein n=1 Tax=Blastomyces percursus TaxID=1658174 RepID=A0A1J9RBP1_9EURO|nr:hypothetical protein ACJ73_02690 [Blastomyces percursus]
MSSTASAYDPDEEKDSSDNNSFGRGILPTGFNTSSPPLRNLRLESSTELSSPSKPQSSGSATAHSQSWRNGSRTNRKLPFDSYVELFNDFVQSVADGGVDASGSVFSTSQLGIITWSSKEKEMLFNALERKGKDRIPEIASLLGSKSEMEIRDYLAALHRGLERQQLKTRYGKPLILSDVPAASEISEECCQALEDNAIALSRQDEQTKNTMGRRKYGDMWLVNRHVAAMVENGLDAERDRSDDSGNENPDNSHPPPSILATSQLLNTGNWVLLSERIFMNAGKNRIEDNWYHLSVDGETPSLTCEAFADFYALAVSLTRRLVHSSIFFAMSRLRSLERGGYERAKLVRREDVGAAVDILRMSRNSRQFWIGAPRRHNLDVADIRHRKGCKPLPLTYNEVEEELSLEGTRSGTSRASSVALSVAVSETQSESEESPGNDSSDPGVSNPSSPSNTTLNNDEDESCLGPEEIHAASMDQKSSRIEELRLWKLLDQSPLWSLLPEQEDSDIEMGGDDRIAVVRPSGTQKSKQDFIDWRDRVLYRSEWEEFGPDTIVVEEELSENRRKRQRLE